MVFLGLTMDKEATGIGHSGIFTHKEDAEEFVEASGRPATKFRKETVGRVIEITPDGIVEHKRGCSHVKQEAKVTAEPCDDGGPAFPMQDDSNLPDYNGCAGMSTRTWLAGQAMEGLLANGHTGITSAGVIARIALENADSLLRRLKEEPKVEGG